MNEYELCFYLCLILSGISLILENPIGATAALFLSVMYAIIWIAKGTP